jgi:hypothetical protein
VPFMTSSESRQRATEPSGEEPRRAPPGPVLTLSPSGERHASDATVACYVWDPSRPEPNRDWWQAENHWDTRNSAAGADWFVPAKTCQALNSRQFRDHLYFGAPLTIPVLGAPQSQTKELGCALALPAAVLGLLAYPVGAWLAAAAAVLFLAHRLKKRLTGASNDTFLRRISSRLTETAYGFVKYVVVGLAFVALVQLALALFGQFVTSVTVLNVEDALATLRWRLEETLDVSLWDMGLILLVLTGVSLAWPTLGLAERATRVRKVISRAYVVLVCVTSFTFFGALRADQMERAWAPRRSALLPVARDSRSNHHLCACLT